MKIRYEIINNEIQRGFFSDFLQIMVDINEMNRNNIDWCIYWKSMMYQYDDSNLFDKFFYQKNNYTTFTPNRVITNTQIGRNYPIKHPSYEYMIPYSDCVINNNLLGSEFFKSLDNPFTNQGKILGIQRRVTDKFHEYPKNVIDIFEYEKTIMKYFEDGKFDKIFMITDDIESEEYFKSKYGDLFITTDSIKGDKKGARNGVHNCLKSDRDKLAYDVVRDSYLLSQTDFKIITDSNVSSFSLSCNLKRGSWVFID